MQGPPVRTVAITVFYSNLAYFQFTAGVVVFAQCGDWWDAMISWPVG